MSSRDSKSNHVRLSSLNARQHAALEEAIEKDRIERELRLQDSDSDQSDHHVEDHDVREKAAVPYGVHYCSECLGDESGGPSGCICDVANEMDDSLELDAPRPAPQPSLQRLRKRKPSEIADAAEYAFLWYYDTRKSYKPWWADDYLRLPPYQFCRAPAPDQEAEGDSTGDRRDSQGHGDPQPGEGEGPSPRAPPLSHVRYSGGEEGGVSASFSRERIREKKAAAKSRAYSARARLVSKLYGQLFKSDLD